MSSQSIVDYYHNRENQWTSFIRKKIPGASLLRWGENHRVFKYKNRVFKVDHFSVADKNSMQSLYYEFNLLISSKNIINDFNPKYYEVDGLWSVLEIDFIDGVYFEDIWKQGNTLDISILKMILKVFLISISGIYYKQLRARHIIIRENGELVFIDFGNSKKMSALLALILNFSPIIKMNSRWQFGRLASLIYEILKTRLNDEKVRVVDENDRAIENWKLNLARSNKELPINIKNKFGDINAYDNFTAMELKMFEAVKKNPKIALDAIEFKFDGYGMIAKNDWGYIWDSIRRKVDLNKKKVIVLGSGMGGVGAFARMEGASIAISYESDQYLLDASIHCSKALGYFDNNFHLVSFDNITSRLQKLEKGDIIFVLSSRFENFNQSALIKLTSKYNQVVLMTKNPKEGSNEFIKNGFSKIDLLLRVDQSRFILHAIK